MKKRHLVVALAFAGAFVGSASYGIANNVQINKEINCINAKLSTLNEGESEEKKLIEELKAKILELTNSDLVKSIVSYSTTVASVVGFIITLAKYRKYKSISSTEIAELTATVSKEAMEKKYEELENKVVNKLIEKFANIENAISVLQNIMYLAQDTTTKGRAALIEYIEKKASENPSTKEEVKETIQEVKENIEEKAEKEAEIKEEVQKDYNPIAVE